MLDFSFGELMMIGAVALVVLGPERLPRVARAFGEMLGKAQRYVLQVRSEFQREIELADLKRVQEEARKAAASLESSFRQVAGSVQGAADQASAEMSAAEASVPAGRPGAGRRTASARAPARPLRWTTWPKQSSGCSGGRPRAPQPGLAGTVTLRARA